MCLNSFCTPTKTNKQKLANAKFTTYIYQCLTITCNITSNIICLFFFILLNYKCSIKLMLHITTLCFRKNRTPKAGRQKFIKIRSPKMIFHTVHCHSVADSLCLKGLVWVEYQLHGFHGSKSNAIDELVLNQEDAPHDSTNCQGNWDTSLVGISNYPTRFATEVR